MPAAPQILDFGPSPYSRAAEGIGAGFSGQYLKNLQQAEEQSSLDQLISSLKPGMKEEDVLKQVLGQKGLDFEKKLKATSAINEVMEQTRKRKMQDQLFGGDAKENNVDSVNVQGDMNRQPAGIIDSSGGDGGEGAGIGAPRPQNAPTGQPNASGNPFTGNPRNWRDIDLLALESADPKLGKAFRDQKTAAVKQWNEDRKYEQKAAQKYLEGIDAEEEALPGLERSLDIAIQAGVGQGWLERMGNMVADLSGFENLRSAKGAQLANASKQYLLSDLSSIKGRPNQWIEQQISKAFLTSGRGDQQQELVGRAIRSNINLKKEKIRLTREIEEKYRKEHGFVPGNIGSIVNEQMKPFQRMESENLAYDLQSLNEKYEGFKLAEVTKGTPLTLGMSRFLMDTYKGDEAKAEKAARRLGYTIPPEEVYQRHLQQ